MNRKQQYREFIYMVYSLLREAYLYDIPIRLGEAHRTKYQAIENIRKGVSKTLNSRHRWSLAIDLWIIKPYKGQPGKGIVWWDKKEKNYNP